MQVLQGLIDQFRLTWRLIKDPRVPIFLKAIPFLGLLYVISPIDFIPDVILGVGQLDDIGIILAGMKMFEMMVPPFVVEEHRNAMHYGSPVNSDRDVIDGSRLRIDRDSEKPKRG